MVSILAYNITSPLGDTVSDNFDAVVAGRGSIRQWQGHRGIPGSYAASLFGDDFLSAVTQPGLSPLEGIALLSAYRAIAGAGIDVAKGRTLFVLCTTKGNVSWLGDGTHATERSLPVSSAGAIASRLGIDTEPVVVDNACISGLSALITAGRLLEMGLYDNAVVCGAETQCKFIISGFQSLKALSPQPCRPFDIERMGLNLGDGAATMVLGRDDGGAFAAERETAGGSHPWKIVKGCVRNDAHHLSAPSKDGDGACMALRQCMEGLSADDVAFVNAHGTATLFNDQMESVAIERAGLGTVPVNALKGYYGHTMGACGILETILSMCAVDNGVVLPTKGFSEMGVSGKIHVTRNMEKTSRQGFIKMLSGFGGGNAAIVVAKGGSPLAVSSGRNGGGSMASHDDALKATHHVRITESAVEVDGKPVAVSSEGKPMLTELYKEHVGDYPRFYKMDMLCRLGFIATELLLQAEGGGRFTDRADRAVVLMGHSGSVVADRHYLETISNADDYYPSPERFVYTLPNIVTGEIAIRNRYHGETAFYLLRDNNPVLVYRILRSHFGDHATRSLIGGWLECPDEEHFTADISIIARDGGESNGKEA